MPKQGEIDYLQNIGADGVRHAVNKPYSDVDCGTYLMSIGIIMNFLPRPPARVLDLGCGTGWTSVLFARRGYDVIGQDIFPDMIYHARENRDRAGLDNLDFVVGDYEDMTFDAEFEAAVFFDALHHSLDEVAAVKTAFRALKPGGVCITSEPGEGHADAPWSKEAVEKLNVTERDMPPSRIIRAGKLAGFRTFQTFDHAHTVRELHYGRSARSRWRQLRAALKPLVREGSSIVVMSKTN